ncbi:MAG: hypothetical protein ABFS37_16555 [Acidobacteriota bacterium]
MVDLGTPSVRSGHATVGRAVPVRSVGTVLVLVVAFPGVASAYVDPGIVGMLFQAIFVFVFGFFLTVVTKPIQLIKRGLVKLGLRKETEDGREDGGPGEPAEETQKHNNGD